MNEIDWTRISDTELSAWEGRIALVETLLDEALDERERIEARRRYRLQHGVSERTIRNYLKRYRDSGRQGLLFHRTADRARSPRIHDAELRSKILELIEERPRRTVTQLRRLLSSQPQYEHAISQVSDRSIYRFLSEHRLSRKEREAKAVDGGRRSFVQFQASASMELVQGSVFS